MSELEVIERRLTRAAAGERAKAYSVVALGGHPNLVRPESLRVTETTGGSVVLALSQSSCNLGISLAEWLRHPQSQEVRRRVALQLLDGVRYLHDCGVFHQHLTSEDIFVDKDNVLRVGNFLHAITDPNTDLCYACGRNYRPPESIVDASCGNPEKVDVWSVGCLLFEIATSQGALTLVSSRSEDGIVKPALLKQQICDIVSLVGTPKDDECGGYTDRHKAFLLKLPHTENGILVRVVESGVTDEPQLWSDVIARALAFHPSKRASVSELREMFGGSAQKHPPPPSVFEDLNELSKKLHSP